jgi:hypothetical protein
MAQPPDEVLVLLLRHPALLCDYLWAEIALAGWSTAVPLKSIAAREVVATAITEMDFQRMPLRALAMTFELVKVFELRVWAEATLDRLDRPTREVGLRSLEEQPIHWPENAGDNKKLCCFLMLLLHRAVNMVHRSLINAPLDPTRLPIRGLHRPILLETWSRQGLVVNALRTRGREPLRSASRLLGFTANTLFGDPGHRLAAGPSHGPRCLRDPLCCSTAPGSFGGRHLVCVGRRVSIAQRLFCLVATFPEDRAGGKCLCQI